MFNAEINRRLLDELRRYERTPGFNPFKVVAKGAAIAALAANSSKLRNAKGAVQSLARGAKPRTGQLVEAPVTKSLIVRQKPAMASSGSGMVAKPYKSRGPNRVVHRELLNPSVASHSSFTVENVYAIQPGLASSFPWVSTIGSNYEQYTIHKLAYHFVPFVSTSTAGTIMMMVDYNAQDPIPTTETQFMDHPKAVSAPIWEPFSFNVDVREFKALGARRFIRPTAVAGDIKTFDLGRFMIASDNSTTTPCGKLYVEYDIEFFTPQLEPSTGLTPVKYSVYPIYPSGQVVTKNVDTKVKFDVAAFDPLSIGNPASDGTLAGTVFTPPAGVYKISLILTTTDDTAEGCNTYLRFFRNLVVYPAGTTVYSKVTTDGANQFANTSLSWIFPMNGTDTFCAVVVMDGAAGALTTKSAVLTFELA